MSLPAFDDRRFADLNLHARSFFASGQLLVPSFPAQGRRWFVNGGSGAASDDGTGGNDQNSGESWQHARRTMADVFNDNNFGSGDEVYFKGNIREQLTIPDGVFDVTIIGAGNRPRHADAHTASGVGGGGYSGATWKLPASAASDTPLLRVKNQGWRLVNFLMTAASSQVCVDLVTNSESGDDEFSAGHFSCYGMRFDGAGIGIRDNGPAGFVGIHDSFFRGMTTAIAAVAGAGPGTRSWWEITGNRLESNTNHIQIALDRALIERNRLMAFTTKGLDISGGSVGLNLVTGNYFSGDYSNTGGYTAGANDSWIGNFATDVAEDEVEASGLTNAVPAA